MVTWYGTPALGIAVPRVVVLLVAVFMLIIFWCLLLPIIDFADVVQRAWYHRMVLDSGLKESYLAQKFGGC